MTDTRVAAEPMRARLQLAIGALAELGARVVAPDCETAFTAIDRTDGHALTVTLLNSPPGGPDADALCQRVAELRQFDHIGLDIPVATGELEGRAWLIEPAPTAPAAIVRLAAGPLSIVEAVTALRDVTRTLAAMHRRGMAHGAVSLETVRLDDGRARLIGPGRALEASKLDDLDALAKVAWALFTGESDPLPARPLSRMRRGVSPELDALCAAMLAPNRAHRPQSAEAILVALDAVPTRRPSSQGVMVDTNRTDARPRRRAGWLMFGVAVVALVILLAFRG